LISNYKKPREEEKEPAAYVSSYRPRMDETMDRILNREDFSYDINGDALYAHYRDNYTRMGRQAMEDTVGKVSSLTGGYGNSYAQTAGQQSYQEHLGQLSEITPKLYAQALERYKQEGQNLRDRYEAARELEQQEYGRHKDALDAYRKDLSYLQAQADQAYDRGYQQYLEEYKQAGDRYTRLLYMMEKLGYKPTEEELLAAGLTKEQAAAFMK